MSATPVHGAASSEPAPATPIRPTADFNGTDTFTFRANDGELDSNTATATITVHPVNDPPTCAAGVTTTAEDTAAVVNLNCSDIDGDPLSVYRARQRLPRTGSRSSGSPTAVTYTPSPNYNGPDAFGFTVSDGQTVSDPATFSITVTPVNDPPVCAVQRVDVKQGTARSANVVCTDVDGDTLSYTKLERAGRTVRSRSPSSGAINYTPKITFIGLDPFTHPGEDGGADSIVNPVTREGTVTLDVRADPYARTRYAAGDRPG